LTKAAGPIIERLGELAEELMATALAGVERGAVEKMVGQLAIVKENLRQAIAQKTDPKPAAAEEEKRYG
jgi:hypothetical protein